MLRDMVSAGVTTCVMEVSSIAIELHRINALDFKIGIFTNLTQDHLDFHKTMGNYAAAKYKFFNSLSTTAVAITNADDQYGEYMVKTTHANAHSYGMDDGSKFGNSDLVASDISYSLRGTSFTIKKRYSDESARVSSKLVGRFNVENMLAAMSALYFGVEGFSLQVLAELSDKIAPVHGRFEQIELPNGAISIIDYAHTPDALDNVLQTIRELSPDANVITVFGCGGDRDKAKRPIMGAIAEKFSNSVIITNDNPRTEDPVTIANEIKAGLSPDTNAEIILDRSEAIRKALSQADAHSVVLLAGKGHEDYQIIGKEKRHFDDREEVQKFLN
jgi:UDP-N-acetylmuramoyl-L-alanyl-D-glutamate--2,6-diaminopimelate ligase